MRGTKYAAASAPTFVPALKMPVANARSFRGNHSAVVLMAAGKFPDSPKPRAARAMLNVFAVDANAVAMAAKLHAVIDAAYPLLTPILSINRPAPRKPMA